MDDSIPRPTERFSARSIAALAAGCLALALASPGVLDGSGSALLALAGVALWGLGSSGPSSRPRLSFLLEVVCAGAAWCWICSWSALVHWGSLLFIGPGMGLYAALSGWLLRGIAVRFSPALALPAAWVCVEVVRSSLEPPFGLPWMRLGTHLHACSALAGSARLWGFFGLSWVLAAAAGGIVGCVRERARWKRHALLALTPAFVALVAARVWRAPELRDGPRVLLVQPGVPQERKMAGATAEELFSLQRELTAQGVRAAADSDSAAPDLVVWGETMLSIPVADPALARAVEAGMKAPPWAFYDVGPRELEQLESLERNWVGRSLFGIAAPALRVLPPGASFVSGAEVLFPFEGRIRRQNAVALWNADGKRAGAVGKRHIVPGAETMLGLERFAFVRRAIHALAGYVPDLAPRVGKPWLELVTRDGSRYRFGVSICFDNAFDDPFTQPLRESPIDFHLVVSNEAWFRESLEFDQMLAFSRILAIGTGRSIVRATNSGVSTVIDPSGRELGRVEAQGRDRAISGTLVRSVPVPALAGAAERTPFVRSELFWLVLGALAAPVLVASGRRGGYRGSARA